VSTQPNRIEALGQLIRKRIVIIDGAMGTMLQAHKLAEADFRGERFKDWARDVKGLNDLLNLTKPALIEEIHRQYLDAGADIVETNTFNSQSISLADYGMESLAYEMSKAGGECARRAADDDERIAVVLGDRTLTMPAALEDALRFVAAGGTFAVRELDERGRAVVFAPEQHRGSYRVVGEAGESKPGAGSGGAGSGSSGSSAGAGSLGGNSSGSGLGGGVDGGGSPSGLGGSRGSSTMPRRFPRA